MTLTWARRLMLASVALLLAAALGEADAASHKQRHPAAPATTSRDVENETTGTIPIKPAQRQDAAAAASATSPDDEVLPPPFHLPAAPRKRMRDCGLKWQAMKMSGEAGDDIWRAFATRCLSAANGPFDTKQSDR